MLTKEQEKWINHLSDTDHVKIADFDPTCDEKFEKLKMSVQTVLGQETEVLHRGSSALRISGQPEIDVYIPVPPQMFDQVVTKMKRAFGKPYSEYPLERVKFILKIDGRKVEVMVVNSSHKSWTDGEKVFHHLLNNSADRKRYEKLKGDCVGLSTRSFYSKKIEFFNEILAAHPDIQSSKHEL